MLEGRDTVIFNKVNRKALWKMQHVIKDLKERWEQVCGYLGIEHSRQQEQQVQRSWGRKEAGMLENRQGLGSPL